MNCPAFHEEVPVGEVRRGDLVSFYSTKGGQRLGTCSDTKRMTIMVRRNTASGPGLGKEETVAKASIQNVWRDSVLVDKERID